MKEIPPIDASIVIINEFKEFGKYNIIYKNDKQIIYTHEIDYPTFLQFIKDPNFKLVLESATLRTWKKIRYRKQSLFDL